MNSTRIQSTDACGVQTRHLTRLPIPVPPNLEAVLGYTGRDQHIGFWLFQGGLHIEDRTADLNRAMFMVLGLKLFMEHPAMTAMTQERGIRVSPGPDHAMADYGLMLDRKNRTLFLALTSDISHFLRTPFQEIHSDPSISGYSSQSSPLHPYTQSKAAERMQAWVESTLDPFWAMVQDGLRRAGPGGC